MPESFVDQTVSSGSVPIAIRDFGGSGPSVLLLHGLGGNLADWTAVVRILSVHNRVLALDLRSHGASGDGEWEWTAVLDDIETVVKDVGLHNPAIVGTSMGGMIAVLWGARHPHCPGVVNIDGHPSPGRPEQYVGMDPDTVTVELDRLRSTFSAMSTAMAAPLSATQVTAMLDQQRTLARDYGLPEAEFVESTMRSMSTRDGVTLVRPFAENLAEIRAAQEGLDIVTAYQRVNCPLLIALATENMPGQEEFADLLHAYRRGLCRDLAALAETQPNLRVTHVEGATHAMVAERPQQLAASVGEFING